MARLTGAAPGEPGSPTSPASPSSPPAAKAVLDQFEGSAIHLGFYKEVRRNVLGRLAGTARVHVDMLESPAPYNYDLDLPADVVAESPAFVDQAWFDYPSLGLRDYKQIHSQFTMFLQGLSQCLANVEELADRKTDYVVFCSSPNPVATEDAACFRAAPKCKPKDTCQAYYRIFSRIQRRAARHSRTRTAPPRRASGELDAAPRYAKVRELSFTASNRRPSIHLGRNRRPSFKTGEIGAAAGGQKSPFEKSPFKPSLDTVVGSPRTPKAPFAPGAAAQGWAKKGGGSA